MFRGVRKNQFKCLSAASYSDRIGNKQRSSPTIDADGPVIRNRPANTEADVGSSVTLRCDFDANPEPEITWSYESSRRVLSTGPAYTFWMASDMAGKYTCTARVPGFADVTAESHVLLKGSFFDFKQNHSFGDS